MAIEQLNLKLTEEKESSFATNRIGAVIEKESDVYKILSCDEGSLCRLVNGLAYDDVPSPPTHMIGTARI
eukprot:scaffold2709_cov215-Skeletonema_marinoi.AAC.9